METRKVILEKISPKMCERIVTKYFKEFPIVYESNLFAIEDGTIRISDEAIDVLCNIRNRISKLRNAGQL